MRALLTILACASLCGAADLKTGAPAPPLTLSSLLQAPSGTEATWEALKGNVVVVPTAPCWDDDLDALQQRLEKLNEKMDQEAKQDPSLTPEAKDAARQKASAETFTPEELKRLKGLSNGGYHYLGAAKIMAPIGKTFAEAMVNLQKTQRQEKQ